MGTERRFVYAGSCTCGRGIVSESGYITWWYCCSPVYDDQGNVVGHGLKAFLGREEQKVKASPAARTPRTPAGQAEIARAEPCPPGMVMAVYWRYDADGALLYVGKSQWLLSRAFMHASESLWVQFAAGTGVNRWFATKEEAGAAEITAIKEERPLFNRHHSAPGACDRLVAYLAERGREDLVDTVKAWTWGYATRGSRRGLRSDE